MASSPNNIILNLAGFRPRRCGLMLMKVVREKTPYHTYAVEFEFSPTLLEYCRQLKNTYGWKKFTFFQGKWRFSDPEIILEIQKYHPLVMDEETKMVVAAAEARSKEAAMIEARAAQLKQATDTDYKVENIRGELYPYQKIGVEFLVNNKGRAILADGMGLGKSLQSLAYLAHNGVKRTLVVCPASVKFSWQNEVKKWTKLKSLVISSDSDYEEFYRKDVNVFIINYDLLTKFLDVLTTVRWECVIADEAHMAKSRTAQRTKALKLITAYSPAVLFLSGTPFLNRPVELFTLLNMTDPHAWPNYYEYTARYCDGKKTRWGWEAKGATNMVELQQKISKYFLRRTKEQVLPDLPKKMLIDVPVALDGKTWGEYVFAQNSFTRYLRDIKKKPAYELAKMNMATEKLVQLGALRALTTKGKIKAAKEIIENVLEAGEKILVFCCYNEPLSELAKEFPEAVMITGKTAQEERGEIVRKFQEDPNCRVFLGGMKSAGVGITLTAATNVLFIDYSWTPADHAQAADRAHRIGQDFPVNVYQLYAKGTIDEMMTDILSEKKMLFDVIIDGKEVDDQGRLLMDELIKRLGDAEELSEIDPD